MEQDNYLTDSDDGFLSDISEEDIIEFEHPFLNIIHKLGADEFMRNWNSDPVQECLERAVNNFFQDHRSQKQWNKRDPLWNISHTNWWNFQLCVNFEEKIRNDNVVFSTENEKTEAFGNYRREFGPKQNTIESIFWPDGGRYLQETTIAFIDQALGGIVTVQDYNPRGLVIWNSPEGQQYSVSILLSCLDFMGQKYRYSHRRYKERFMEIYMHTESESEDNWSDNEINSSEERYFGTFLDFDFETNWKQFNGAWKTDEVQTALEEAVRQFMTDNNITHMVWKKGDPLWELDNTDWWYDEINRRVEILEEEENSFDNFRQRIQQIYGRKFTHQQICDKYFAICMPALQEQASPKPHTLESLYLPGAGKYLVTPLLRAVEIMYPHYHVFWRRSSERNNHEVICNETKTRFNLAQGFRDTLSVFKGLCD